MPHRNGFPLVLACLFCLTGGATAQTGTGLTGKYYDGADFTTLKTTRTDGTLNFSWGTAIPTGTTLTSADSFSVAWTGQIEPAYSELYTFYVTADDGARLWVNDQMIVGRTFYQGNGEMRGQIRLKAGHRVNIRLEYIENSGSASAKLEWASASQARQIIPTARLYPTTEVPNGGSLMREVWTGLPGTSFTTLTSNASYPNKPASRDFINSFECIAQNWEDNFGTRVTGYIRAPASGNYTFAVSGDEVVQLYLSTDSTAANKALLAGVGSPTAFRQWDAQPSQQSAPRALVGGQKYYVELLHKEGAGSDHWSVGWKTPGDAAFSVIPGTALMMPGTDTAQPATANFFNTLATEQPRLGVSRERFLWLKQQYQSPMPSNAKTRAQAVINTATGELTAAPLTQRQAQDRIQRLALAWWLTGDNQYAEAAWNNINHAINNGSWTDPWKGVENGVIAIGYDWLYPYWSQARKDAMVSCMVNKGFGPGWTDSYTNNIGVIISSGHLMATLAVGTVNETASENAMATAISRLTARVERFNANSGAWYEGTDYGIFTKWGLGQAMPSMECALGSTFGLSRIGGVSAMAREPLTIASNTRQRFTFSDIGTGSEAAAGWANWWARRFNALETFDYSRQIGNSPLNALTLPETTISPSAAGLNPDTAYRGPVDSTNKLFQEVVTLRENWTDSKATFVGALGGTYQDHGHLQSGSFQLMARGVKWFQDLSSEDYASPQNWNIRTNPNGLDRWDYYRYRAEGHNCLIVNPSANPDRIWDAPPAPLISYQSAQNGQRSFAIWDLSKNITGVTRVQRGIQLLNKRREVLVQDEIVAPSGSTAWWFAHFNNTSTSATIGPDGTSVTLQQGTQRLWCKILSGGGTWTIRPAEPLPTSPNPATYGAQNGNNSSRSKLSINLTNAANTTLAVWFVPLAPGEDPPVTTPTITALNTWSLIGSQSEPPVALNSGINSVGSEPVDVNLRLLAKDDWTPTEQLTFAVGGAVGGTVALLPDGFTARFTPISGFAGAQSFTFTATDGDGATSNAATISISATPVVTNWTSATSGNWSTGANWQEGTAPISSPGADLQFFNGQTLAATTITATNDLPGTSNANKLTFSGTGTPTTVVNLGGNPLRLVRNGAASPVINLTGTTAGYRYNISNDIALDETVTVNANNSGTFVFNGAITGSGGLTRTNTYSTLILAGNNSYAGPTTIGAGTLQIGNDGATGTLGSGPVEIESGATLRFDRTGTLNVPNDIGGAGALAVSGGAMTDVVALGGANTFTGGVTVTGGSLRITDAGQLGDGTKSITISGAAAALRLDGSGGGIELPTSFKLITSNPNGAIINEAGDNRIGGSVTLTAGTGNTRLTSLADTLTIEGNVAPNTTGRSLDLRGAGKGVIHGNVLDGSTTNTLTGLSKNDAGTWTLNGNNAFTGATTVSAGRLVINGSHVSGNVTVSSGATLGGSGSIAAPTTVSGTLAPGDGIGAINFGSALSFGSASRLQWQLGANSLAGGDSVACAGNISVTAGAKIDVALNAPGSETTYVLSFWRSPRTWPLIAGPSITGTFALGTVSGDAAGHATATYGSFSLQQTATAVNLVWTPIPGFPVIEEPLVTILQPTGSTVSLPDGASAMRVVASAAGGGTTTYAWSVVNGDGTGTGAVTFADASAADTTVSFSDPGTYILRCTATNEAVSRSKDFVVNVAPPTTAVLREGLGGYSQAAAYIQANSTAWNHGADPQLLVGRNAGSHRAVLSFPLDAVPAGAVIRGVRLDLWTDTVPGTGTVGTVELHRLTRGFVEGAGDGSAVANGAGTGVTWASANGTDTWSSPGGSYDAGVLGSVSGFDATLVGQQRSFAGTSGLVAAAQSALDTGATLDLMVLSPTTEANAAANNYAIFKSNDHADETQRPQLTVEFSYNELPAVDPGPAPDAGVGFVTPLAGSISSGATGRWSLVSGPGTAAFADEEKTATSVVFSQSGTYVLRLTGINSFGEASRDLTVNVLSVPAGFVAWQGTNWPGVTDPLIAGPAADPDGDGVTNAVEYAAGTNPTSNTSLPAFVWNRLANGAWSNGGNWQIGAAPASNALTRIEFFTGMSSNLAITATNDTGNFTLQSLSLNGTGNGTTTIAGGAISFAAGGVLNLGSAGYNIVAPVVLSAATTVQGSGSAGISGALSGSGALTMNGTGTLTISGPHALGGAVSVNAGTFRITGAGTSGGSILVRGGNLAVSGNGSLAPASGAALTLGGSAVGVLNYDSSALSRFGAITIGNGNDGAGNSLLSQSSGTIAATSLTLNNGFTSQGAGDVNLSGGSFAVSGTATLSNQVAADNVWSTVTVSGNGSLTVGAGLKLTGAPAAGRNAAGRVVQNGGTVTVAGGLNMARTTTGNAAAHRGEYNLNGGTLNVNQITQDAGTDTFGTFNFNGGTLKPTAENATFMQGLTAVQIKTGGALIDTNGFDITIAQALVGAAGSSGGLTKSGAGVLTLSGASSYNGTTNLTAGRLTLAGSLAGDAVVNGGTLGFGSTAAIAGNLTLGGAGRFEAAVGAVPGQLTVGGGVVLGGTLDIVAPMGLAAGTQFTILNTTSDGLITGTFAGLPEGCAFTAGGTSWIISYTGGTGNDVALTVSDVATVWRWTNFGTTANAGSAADSADPDGDGEANLLEFATGQDPNARTSQTTSLTLNGPNLEFTYVRSTAAVAGGMTFAVEWSDTLAEGSWTSMGSGTLIADNGILQIMKAIVPAGSGNKRFVRLKMSQP